MANPKAISKNVDPRLAAVIIVMVLAIVQAVWWKGLVSMNRGKQGFAPPAGGGGGRPDPAIAGMPEAQVETLAGAQEPGDRDGAGRDARFDTPSGLAVDRHGGLYVADTRNNRIRYVASDGVTQTVSGREPGFRDGPAEQARFHGPTGIAVTADDQIYISDTLNNRIRRIRSGVVETVAGGEAGMADGPGASARFNAPAGISIADGGRKLIVADAGNKRIRVVDVSSPNATVATAAQTTSPPTCAFVSGASYASTLPDEGTILIGATRAKNVPVQLGEYSGEVKDDAIALRSPIAICPTAKGWYEADAAQAAVLLVSNGSAKVVAGVAKAGKGPRIGFRDGTGDEAGLGLVGGIATDSSGMIYFADATNNAIRRIRFGDAPKPAAEGQKQWHPGEDYRSWAIKSSQGRDTGRLSGPVGPHYVGKGQR